MFTVCTILYILDIIKRYNSWYQEALAVRKNGYEENNYKGLSNTPTSAKNKICKTPTECKA